MTDATPPAPQFLISLTDGSLATLDPGVALNLTEQWACFITPAPDGTSAPITVAVIPRERILMIRLVTPTSAPSEATPERTATVTPLTAAMHAHPAHR